MLASSVKGAARIVAANRQAHALGLKPGLALADARARVPDIAAADHDAEADAALLKRLAEASDRWTPLVALDPPHGLILDVTGCAHLLGGEQALRADVLKRLRLSGFSVRGVIAGTPDAARALALYGGVEIVMSGFEEEAIRPLPVAALDLSEADRAALSLAGLRRIGDLATMPRGPLAARFGHELCAKLWRTLGRDDIRITPLRAPPAVRAERLFAEPIAHQETIEQALKGLIAEAAEMLMAIGHGGRAIEASFFRTDGAVRRLTVETGRPTRDSGAIFRLLREKLDALADPLDPGFGFDLMRLSVPVSEPLGQAQPGLDGKAIEDDEIADLVDRLTARFGAERVLRFAAADTHAPSRASRLMPAAAVALKREAWTEAEPGEPPLRPLKLFEPPQPIETLAEAPDGPPLRFRWRRALHRVVRAEGPERIAAEWWRTHGQPTRDYYRVEDEEGRRFWLFRAGLYERETTEPRWYLHGLFA